MWKRADGGGVPDYTDQYNTPLNSADEARFQSWAADNGRAGDTYDYDLRGLWKSGAGFASNGHGTDTYKKPNHPTFSTGSRYSTADSPGGRWTRDSYDPSATNLQMYGPAGLRDYFARREPGVDLMIQRAVGGGFVRRADGGYAPAAGSDPYASASPIQSADVADPSSQQMLQRFSGMPYEQLQETVLRIGPASKMGQLAQRVLQQKRAMPAPQQAARPGIGLPRPQQPATPQQDTSLQPGLGAITSALKQGFGKEQPEEPQADQGSVGYAGGGMTTKHPPWTRSGQTMMRSSGAPTAGFLRSKVPGRTDALHGTPAANSYVIPADVVSGFGEGNSPAGAHALQMALSTGPGGIPLPHGGGGHGVRAPHMARGGAAEKVDVHLAGGEYIVTPEQVAAIGGGDIKHGHHILDLFVKHARKKQIKTLQHLPGPVKS